MKTKLVLSIVSIAALFTLAACNGNKNIYSDMPKSVTHQPASKLTPAQKQKACNKIKKQLRTLNRQAPDFQSKVEGLEQQLNNLNCGAK